ncbi:MAG TPA: hypothetical protein VFD70_16345 [Anaerolineae bacterium]|nr:hypothetical protein [Anaerolineae bacterium]
MNELDLSEQQFLKTIVRVMLGAFALCLVALIVLLWQTPLGGVWNHLLDALFGISSTHMYWYITRASGIVAYLLLWLSTVWGLAVSSKMFDRLLPRAFTYDAHEFLSLLAILFTIMHVVVLMFDSFMPFSFTQLWIPFVSDYRPFWIGIGIIGTYLTLLVTITFYIRKWIGIRSFRVIHYLSFAAYIGVTIHSWFSGTDTPLAASELMYLGTALVIVFMTVYWLVLVRLDKNDLGSGENQRMEPQPAFSEQNPANAPYLLHRVQSDKNS